MNQHNKLPNNGMKRKTLVTCLLLAVTTVSIVACNDGGTNTPSLKFNSQTGLTGSVCDSIPPWSATTSYANAGTLVVRNGKEYKNNWWTQDNDPETNNGASGTGQPWTLVADCGTAPPVSPTMTPTPVPTVSPTMVPPLPESSGLPATIAFKGTSTASGALYFHLNLPVGTGNVETVQLSNNFTDLIISNYVSGAVLGNMIRTTYPKINFNRDYIYGTLWGQLLQENINTGGYVNNTDYINTLTEQKSLLAAGQGGPYQINDYSKRLENNSGLGMINYVAIQKGLGFTVAAQDDNSQTNKPGPLSLDHKYFGPLAAAYFHFNDINRLALNNAETWGPQYKYYANCMNNIASTKSSGDNANNMYDMILNAAYNAGTYSMIIGDYFRICAGMYTTGVEAQQISSIGDYSLNDTQYQSKIGTKEAVGSTFILYPRQIRIYLDQIYHKQNFTSQAFNGNVQIVLSASDIQNVFVNVMRDVAYQHDNSYTYISTADATTAFKSALTAVGATSTSSYNLASASEKTKFFDLLDKAVAQISTNLKFNFAQVTQTTIGGGVSPTPTPTTQPSNKCPSTAPLYPDDLGGYASGTVVKASDGNYYSCNAGVATWCNSPAQWAYAPVGGTASSSAWTRYTCQ